MGSRNIAQQAYHKLLSVGLAPYVAEQFVRLTSTLDHHDIARGVAGTGSYFVWRDTPQGFNWWHENTGGRPLS